MMLHDHAEGLIAALERIADAVESIAARLEENETEEKQRAEEAAILQKRIEEAEARRKHQ